MNYNRILIVVIEKHQMKHAHIMVVKCCISSLDHCRQKPTPPARQSRQIPDVLGAKYGAFETNMAHCGGWNGLGSGAEECSRPIRYGNAILERVSWARQMLEAKTAVWRFA